MSIGKDHRIELERYAGPLDLLLWLIRREEVDIHDIPIARILERYLEMLQTVELLDLDQAGEFLVLASQLMQIKTRALLPRDEPLEDEDLDPRFELVQKLLEYRRFKEVSEELRQRAEGWGRRHAPGRAPDQPGVPPDELPISEVSLWDLALAFQRVLDEVEVRGPRSIIYDDVPLEAHIETVLEAIQANSRLSFREVFPTGADRTRIAGLFLAVLELIRRRRLRAAQDHPFGPILLVAVPEETAEA